MEPFYKDMEHFDGEDEDNVIKHFDKEDEDQEMEHLDKKMDYFYEETDHLKWVIFTRKWSILMRKTRTLQ